MAAVKMLRWPLLAYRLGNHQELTEISWPASRLRPLVGLPRVRCVPLATSQVSALPLAWELLLLHSDPPAVIQRQPCPPTPRVNSEAPLGLGAGWLWSIFVLPPRASSRPGGLDGEGGHVGARVTRRPQAAACRLADTISAPCSSLSVP